MCINKLYVYSVVEQFCEIMALLMLGAHVHGGYDSLSVCLFVCYQSTDCLRGLQNIVNIPVGFTINIEHFQLRNFSKKLSFKSYGINRPF